MSVLWTALATLLVLLLATWLHLVFWVRRISLPMPYDLTLRVPTPDGSAFELRRILPSNPSDLPPVMLVHGIAINHRNLDMHPDVSLARALAASGRDTWLLTLRSGRADLTRKESLGVRFSAMAQHDVPLAVAEVLARTGAKHLDYVGFSMGGMLLYATLGRSLPEAQVRRAVILGSPARVAPIVPLGNLAIALPIWLMPAVPFRLIGRLFAFGSEWFRTPMHGLTMNLANMAPGLCRITMVDALSDVPFALAVEFGQWAYRDGLPRVGEVLALEGLENVRVPVHFFVGAGDKLGAPKAVRIAFDAWGRDTGARKHWTLLGKREGYSADYGHTDLAGGLQAPTEVFAPAIAFLANDSESA